MPRVASLTLLALLAACGSRMDGESSTGDTASPVAPTSAATPRLVAHDDAQGYCGTFYSFCPMFTLGGRVYFRALKASPDSTGPSVASIRSVATSADGAATTLVAEADDPSDLLGPFLGGDGVEWLVQSARSATVTLFTGSGAARGDARALATIAGTALTAADDARAIYLFTTTSSLVRVSKDDGDARVVGSLDGFVPIAAVADADADGSLYATGFGGIARVAKGTALLTTLSIDTQGSQYGDRLSVAANELFAAQEQSTTSAIVARPLGGGALRTVASSDGGSSSIVVDGDSVYWIAVSEDAAHRVTSALWRAPLAGDGAPAQLYAEPSRSTWLTGLALDAASIYVTTTDGRLLALAK